MPKISVICANHLNYSGSTPAACYIQSYFEREHLFTARMCQMKASTLSADHTFKVSSNIGFWCNGKWVRLYDSLFIVMNEAGVVMSWQLCKGTSFSAVEGLLHRLKDRLVTLGCSIGPSPLSANKEFLRQSIFTCKLFSLF